MTSNAHLGVELPRLSKKITVETRYGLVTGARAANDAAVWLGTCCFVLIRNGLELIHL